MRHGSLFSGIGGFDLAAEWMGWDNVFHCEWNPFGQKILKHYWPKSISYEDICKTDFSIHRGAIDIISGGFPCQPFSSAGKRQGTEDSRYLWPEMLRAIREVCPKWVVGENVYGLVNWNEGMVFNTVCSELENEGYEVIPIVLPSASVNAPHKRDRIFFIAHSKNGGCRGWMCKKCSSRERQVLSGESRGSEMGCKVEGCCGIGITPDPELLRLQHSKTAGDFSEGKGEVEGEGSESTGAVKTDGSKWDTSDTGLYDVANSELKGWEGQHREWEGCTEHRSNEGLFTRSEDKLNATDTDSKVLEHRNGEGEDRWDKQEVRTKSFGSPRGWETFPTQPPVCSRDDGFSPRLDNITFSKWRNESIKGYGNAVLPQLVLQIFKTIQDLEKCQ